MKSSELSRTQQLLAATTVALASLSINACTSEQPDNKPSMATPAPATPSPEVSPTPATTPELEAAEEHLENTAAVVTGQILDDMANPASLAQAYNPWPNVYSYGNKRARIEKGINPTEPTPEMYVHYYAAPLVSETTGETVDRGMHINTVRITNPEAPEEQYIFERIHMEFSLGSSHNHLNKAIENNGGLAISDYQEFMKTNADQLTLQQLEVWHGDKSRIITVANTGEDSYMYTLKEDNYGAGPVIIDTANLSRLNEVAQEITDVEAALKASIN